MGRRKMHITKKDGEWRATWEGAERASAKGPAQGEVERRGKQIAQRAGGAEVVIHRPKGQIRDSDTIARPDPNPPRDRKH